MNLDKLASRMLQVARAHPPSDHVPYAFEQRIMARLLALKPLDTWTVWGQALWRGALPCLLVMVLSAIWWFWPGSQANFQPDFSQDFQRAVFAQAAQVDYGE